MYVAPEFQKDAFTCPTYGAYSFHAWTPLLFRRGNSGSFEASGVVRARCAACKKDSIWFHDGPMIFPANPLAPMPNEDMPDDLKADYMEARSIAGQSPRAAAALLRLLIQKLCKKLGEPGKNINSDISSLVKKNRISERTQKSLDSVRVVGNDSVHPGEIDVRDNPKMVATLFELVNLIVLETITIDKTVDSIYGQLPDDKIKAIEKRDQQTE